MQTPESISFTIDHMLLKLGKYLRILGYDAKWDGDERTHELILQANREQRVFLTRNRKLPHQYPIPDRALTLKSVNAVDQLREVVIAFALETKSCLFSRCIRCNVLLESVPDKKEIKEFVHPGAYSRHERFYVCPRCRTVFYKGGHVRNTCAKLNLETP